MFAGLGSWLMQVAGKPLKWWVVIAEWEQGIRVRLGKNSKCLQPGLHFRIPFLDRVYVQNTRLRTCTLAGVVCCSQDNKPVVVNLAYSFCVSNMLAFYNSLPNPEIRMNSVVSAQVVSRARTLFLVEIDGDALVRNLDLSEFEQAGLSNLQVECTGFVSARTYRLINDTSYFGAGLYDLESGHNAKTDR